MALVEHKSFSRAAHAVHVTQPALSAGIRDFENLLGNALVIRDPKSIIPTQIGEAVFERAKAILTDCTDLIAEGSRGEDVLTAKFRLGAIPTIAPFMLPRIFAPLRETYPTLELTMKESQTETLLSDLQNRIIDAALLALPWEIGGLHAEPIFDEAFFALVPTGHALAKKKHLSADDVAMHELLMLEKGHCLRDHALSACKFGETKSMGLSASSLMTLSQMVAEGFGITLLPETARNLADSIAAKAVIKEFDSQSIGRTVALVWRPNSPKAADSAAMATFLKKHWVP